MPSHFNPVKSVLSSCVRRSCAIVIVLCAASGALAQRAVPVPDSASKRTPHTTTAPATPPAASTTPKISPHAAAGGIPLSDQDFHIDSIGLRMRLPAGTEAETVRIGDRTSYQVQPANFSYILNIQSPVTSNEKATIQEAAEKTIALLQGSVGVTDPDQKEILSTQARVIDRLDQIDLPGGPAARFYISLPPDLGTTKPEASKSDRKKAPKPTRIIKGYTIFKPQPRQFVVFELICAESEFSVARTAYETSVGTVSFADSDSIALTRRAAIGAGVELFRQIGEAEYLAAIGTQGNEQWFRLYLPANSGAIMDAQELGYRGLKFWRGERGEVDTRRQRSSWNSTDQQPGFLAQDRSRVLVNGMVADSLATYFMSLDRKEEAWVATTVVKDASGKQIVTVSETGARNGNDMTVVSTETGKPTKTSKPAIAGDGYISQFERALLPRLLASKKFPAEFGFYAWDTASDAISYRRESLSKEKGGALGAEWTLQTIIRDESKSQTTYMRANNDVIGISLTDGRTWESIELADLKRLWQQKGLQTDR